MIQEEENCNISSDETMTSILTPDRFSLYHLQKKHESLQQKQQQKERKNKLLDIDFSSKDNNILSDVASNVSDIDFNRSSSSTSSTFCSDNGSITSSTLTGSSVSSPYGRNILKSLASQDVCDVNNNERGHSLRKEHSHYQRVMSHKKMKHSSKAIQSKVSSKLINKRKLQADSSHTMQKQPFLDDVSLGLLRFYRAATKATTNRSQKLTTSSSQIGHSNCNEKLDKCRKKTDQVHDNKEEGSKTSEGAIFYSMKPEEFLPQFTKDLVRIFHSKSKLSICRTFAHFLVTHIL